MGEKGKEKGKGKDDKITRPESPPEPTKNILTEGKSKLDREETFGNEGKGEGIDIVIDE